MQNNQGCFFTTSPTQNDIEKCLTANITQNNLVQMSIYLTMRHFTKATWLNDRDQFLYPNDGWKADKEFQNDCLAYTLFHGQNRISGKGGVNYWIPFSEQEVDSKERFASNFMTQFICGKLGTPPNPLNKGESIPSDQQVVSPSMRGVGGEIITSMVGIDTSVSPSMRGVGGEIKELAGEMESGETPHCIAEPLKQGQDYVVSPSLRGVGGEMKELTGEILVSTVENKFNYLNNLTSNYKLKANLDLRDRAKQMARNMTQAESLVWDYILKSRQISFKFIKQYIISSYIVDFYCSELHLVIEIDGDSHNESQEYDKVITDLLNHFGLKVIRFTNQEVLSNLEAVMFKIQKQIEQRLKEVNQTQDDVSDNALFIDNQQNFIPTEPLVFSWEAQEVFKAGLELWRYYHSHQSPHRIAELLKQEQDYEVSPLLRGLGGEPYNPNASLYDIREYFQGRNEAGKMNNKSNDEKYNQLISNLREALKILAKKIEPKIYGYEFLK